MWGHYTRVTVTHHCGSGAGGIIALLLAGTACTIAYSAALALIPVLATTIIVLAAITALLLIVLIAAKVYVTLRDRPIYIQFQKDTQIALDRKREHDMIYATSQRVEGDDLCQEGTVRPNKIKPHGTLQ